MKKRNFTPARVLAFCVAACIAPGLAAAKASAQQAPAPFVAVSPDAAELPQIVVQYDAATGTGFDWETKGALNYYQLPHEPNRSLVDSVRYLQEAIQRMTGKELRAVGGKDLSRGIILTTLAGAPADLKNDPGVLQALRNTGEDAYNANEAFFVRSEPNRVVVIGNTIEGISQGIIELLESVEYEVLGMGPNWTHVPDYKTKPLIFSIRKSGRAGFYIRHLGATSGQQVGYGTLFETPLPDAKDETVEKSYRRWLTGTRQPGRSMPDFPGHAMQFYHRAVLDKMRVDKTTEGFLTPKTYLAPDAERPAAAPENNGQMWVNNDAEGGPEAGKVFISDGVKWNQQPANYTWISLDFSVAWVRELIFADMKAQAEKSFSQSPDAVFVFGTDPEDGGGYTDIGRDLKNPNWYLEYLKAEGVKFGQPYVLHGFNGIQQPKEIWDASAASDNVFGLNNYLLREFDQWIDSLPAKERVTASGQSKKSLVRGSFLSYNFHDVPPNFNADPRIRVMIAGFPKHRGQGKWKRVASQADTAKAFQKMLPREPSGEYWLLSEAYHRDGTTAGIAGSESAAAIHRLIGGEYNAGVKALSAELDFNFGKMGLTYYLYTKFLWNQNMSVAELDAIRTRWLQRAFGTGWREMKAYYDFMTPENFTVNAPNNWAKAIRFIQAADEKIEDESIQQQRLDDVKQFWYFYYLLESGQVKTPSREFREFVWKGQMSYMNAMQMVVGLYFPNADYNVRNASGTEFNTGPAHYTHGETQKWWAGVLDFWKVTPVLDFADVVLKNGKTGKDVDVNDLVQVQEFQSQAEDALPADIPLMYNAGINTPVSILTTARKAKEEIGFKLHWLSLDNAFYLQKDVAYGISRWNAATKKWDELVDKSMTVKPSVAAKWPDRETGKETDYHLVEVRYAAPQTGTYRIDIGYGGNSARLTTLDYDPRTGKYSGSRGHTYFSTVDALTQQSPVYFYIPKGTKSLDLETWSVGDGKLHLHTGLPATGMTRTRTIDVTKTGTHTVALNPGEDGSFAALKTDNFGFPFLYSVPLLWAKSPAALLVPREIAAADGLTEVK